MKKKSMIISALVIIAVTLSGCTSSTKTAIKTGILSDASYTPSGHGTNNNEMLLLTFGDGSNIMLVSMAPSTYLYPFYIEAEADRGKSIAVHYEYYPNQPSTFYLVSIDIAG